MNLSRTRVRTDELEGGDIVRRAYRSPKEGEIQEEFRTIVVGQVLPAAVWYREGIHQVIRVVGLDVREGLPVSWLAVPDQHLTVIR